MASSFSRTFRLARITSPLRGGSSSTRVQRLPLASAAGSLLLLPASASSPRPSPSSVPVRLFATQPVTSSPSLLDSSPNWNNRPPPRKTTLDDDCDDSTSDDCGVTSEWSYDGYTSDYCGFTSRWSDGYGFTSDDDIPPPECCDFEHWLVVMKPPPGDPADPDIPREEIIDYYIKVLSKVVGSEEKARQKIYSVSTRHYFAFGALISMEISNKIKELPNVRWVLPDTYLDVENKDYGGEPFINGEAVPYDPKYHEEWVRINERATARRGHNDRLREHYEKMGNHA